MRIVQGRDATLTIGRGGSVQLESITINSPLVVGFASASGVTAWQGTRCLSFPMSRSKGKRIAFKLRHHFFPRRRKLRVSKQS
jgi:hypothetical protein